jgi:two-component system, LytTR family, response regulator
MIRDGDFVLLSDNVNHHLVRNSDILYIEADANYVKVQIANARVLIRRSMKTCEAKLDPSIFFRASRYYIVNLAHVKEVTSYSPKQYAFRMSDGKEVIVSRLQTIKFRKQRLI